MSPPAPTTKQPDTKRKKEVIPVTCSSCKDCPAFVTEDQVPVKFSRARVGAPVCQTFGHILGRPGLSESAESKLWTTFASDCPSAGQEPAEKRTGFPEALVGTADPAAFMGNGRKGAVESCVGCVNYVPAEVVRNELGWYLPLCAAQGRLLFKFRETREPRECDYAEAGTPRTTTDGWFHFDPRYDEAFNWGASHIKVATPVKLDLSAPVVDPRDYPTDKPVEPEWEAAGVRAWRFVGTTPHKVDVFAPIMRTDVFTEAEQKKIPVTGSDDHPELYVDHAGLVYDLIFEWMEQDAIPALWGRAGVGKTELARYLAWLMHMPFDRVSFNSDTEIEDIAGKFLLENGETIWHYGRIPEMYSRPGVGCYDEMNKSPQAVWEFCRPMFDNSKQLVLDQGKGVACNRHPLHFPVITGNPAWASEYVGSKELDEADYNRLTQVWMDLPPEEIERAIIVKRCAVDGYTPNQDTLDAIMRISVDIRAAVNDGALPMDWGVRSTIAVTRKTAGYDLEKAFRRAVTDRLEPETASLVLNFVRDHVA